MNIRHLVCASKGMIPFDILKPPTDEKYKISSWFFDFKNMRMEWERTNMNETGSKIRRLGTDWQYWCEERLEWRTLLDSCQLQSPNDLLYLEVLYARYLEHES